MKKKKKQTIKTIKGINNIQINRCQNCNEKEADSWIADEKSYGGSIFLCVDCYLNRQIGKKELKRLYALNF